VLGYWLDLDLHENSSLIQPQHMNQEEIQTYDEHVIQAPFLTKKTTYIHMRCTLTLT
jgi:hypothetical protein